MRRGVQIIISMILFLASPALADDLYRVEINNQNDAAGLTNTGFDAVVRLDRAYLVMAKEGTDEIFRINDLNSRLIASALDRDKLAVDASLAPDENAPYDVIHEEDGIRLVYVPGGITPDQIGYSGLTPLPVRGLRVIYKEPVKLSMQKDGRSITLDSVISLVEYDSLYSYVHILQAFPNRRTATTGNYLSRDWIYNSLINFGLDSVYIDTFTASLGQAYNVVGVKYGTTFPDHQIVLGGHRDAVAGSPGADDNGSGTAAVMEMARILNDIETNMTFIYILFDAEEQGLYGSWHYANAAAAAGDSIVMMLNLDMCGAENNDGDAKLYHGTDTTYVDIWRDLAASLDGIDIAGHFSGNISASDHYPFSQNGYDIAFPFEYVFSTVYHTYQDSTSHMNFDYMTRMVQASVATAYYVDGYYVPVPSLEFIFRDGAPPEYILPGVETSIGVNAVGTSGGVPVPGTGQLHYKVNGGAVQTVAMPQSSNNRYTAILPPLGCGDLIEYYMSAEEETRGRIYYPDPALAYKPTVATQVLTAFQDDFETARGWTVSGGNWQRGTPTGGSGDHGGPDPTSGHSGSNVYGYNLSGGYENYMPERHLTSPVIDCSAMANTRLKFWRWLGVEQPSYDHAYVRVSNNGSTWTTVWQNGATIDDGGWVAMDIDISAIADGQPTVYLRWTMGTTDGAWTYCGWNIDDVIVTGYICAGAPVITTTDLPDWTAGHGYTQQLQASGGSGSLTWIDKYGDLVGTGLTLSSAGLLSGTVSSSTTISFTAEVTDEALNTDEQLLSFVINPSIIVTTSSLPEWTQGFAFSQTLASTGGTGSIAWSDKYGDLNGSGLTLGTSGQLSGIPSVSGLIEFTALATDQVGASGEKSLQITINPALAITTISLPEWTEGIAYNQTLSATGGTGAITWADKLNNLAGTGLILDDDGVLTGIPVVSGEISFTAVVQDQVGATKEKPFQFEINSAVEITTLSLPDGVAGEEYSFQMAANGGMGALVWTDVNADLDGTGLTLSATGLLSGTPVAELTIDFTAGCDDVLGSHDERVFNLVINAGFICGDVTDEGNVDLLDILFLIDYKYGIPPGNAPDPIESGDVNGDGDVNLIDILYLIDYLYGVPPGPAPNCP